MPQNTTPPAGLPRIESRTLTRDELHAEAKQRFGSDQMDWAFQCPSCGDIATGQEIYDALAHHPVQHPEYDTPMRYEEILGQQCIGRILGPQAQRGCDYVAFGLITAPWMVTLPHYYRPQPCFPLAPAPDGAKKTEADGITRLIVPTQALLTTEPAEAAVPRTERSYWVDIAAALNAAVAAGMPVGIDLDGTLTDHRAWSVVYDHTSQQWTVAGYDEDVKDTALSAQKDTHTGSSAPVWAGFTAREEIIGNLIAAGYNETAAKELLGRADREPHASAIEDEFASTLAGGHALVFEDIGTDERLATCQCGRRLGSVGTPGSSARTDLWFLAWKSHLSTEVSS
ncbi:VVA0879 family protein [Streptomyces tauricus]